MTAEQRERYERWLRQAAAREDECGDFNGGRMVWLAQRFPIPDTASMSPAEAEATLAAWRAEVTRFTAEADALNGSAPPTAAPVMPPAAPPAAAPEAPVA